MKHAQKMTFFTIVLSWLVLLTQQVSTRFKVAVFAGQPLDVVQPLFIWTMIIPAVIIALIIIVVVVESRRLGGFNVKFLKKQMNFIEEDERGYKLSSDAAVFADTIAIGALFLFIFIISLSFSQ